jgi:peroxiredoxin
MPPRPTTPARAALAASLCLALAASAAAYEAGDAVADFTGTDEAGKTHQLSAHRGKVVVLVAWGSRCPFSKAFGPSLDALRKANPQAVFLGLAPNAGETASGVKAAKGAHGIGFPILLDAGGSIATKFGAVMSPTAYVIDAQGKLRYQGAIADKANGPKQRYLADALAAVLAGRSPAVPKTRVRGVRIKY